MAMPARFLRGRLREMAAKLFNEILFWQIMIFSIFTPKEIGKYGVAVL